MTSLGQEDYLMKYFNSAGARSRTDRRRLFFRYSQDSLFLADGRTYFSLTPLREKQATVKKSNVVVSEGALELKCLHSPYTTA